MTPINEHYDSDSDSDSDSTSIRNVAIWSVYDLSCLKRACSSRKMLSTSLFILSRIIMFNTFPGTNNNVIRLKRPRSPFLGNLIV